MFPRKEEGDQCDDTALNARTDGLDHEEIIEDDEDEDDEDFELDAFDEEDLELPSMDLADVGVAQRYDISNEDTIARRTRTKFSLADMSLDTLELMLPEDPIDALLTTEKTQDEYQRFLASLLPHGGHDTENLNFLDEEDEEYHPGDEDDDDDENALDYLPDEVVRISKKELTQLLRDATQVRVPPTFSQGANAAGITSQKLKDPMISAQDTAVIQQIQGTITQAQRIQLASQMHKHFQLLLQSYHLISNPLVPKPTSKKNKEVNVPPTSPVMSEELRLLRDECESMLREMHVRSKRALRHKGRILAKLNPGISSSSVCIGEDVPIEQRRVTRSLTAAHAAVAHPSMFEIIGAHSVDELTSAFAYRCSMNDRDKKLQEHMVETDKHLLQMRKPKYRRPRTDRKYTSNLFTSTEDRLLTHGIQRFGTDNWKDIQRHFLPTKEPALIKKRYWYLVSTKKRGIHADTIKEYHDLYRARRLNPSWSLEEDVCVVRGMIEFYGVGRQFAQIARNHLPHRKRIEIRKRWMRLRSQHMEKNHLEATGSKGNCNGETVSLEWMQTLLKHLETKLRTRLQEPENVSPPPKVVSKPKRRHWSAPTEEEELEAQVAEQTCRDKNLHPALFFTSWAVIAPEILLGRTCLHNWPTFIQDKVANADGTLELVSQTAVSHVEHDTAVSSDEDRLLPAAQFNENPRTVNEWGMDNDIAFYSNDDESDFEREELLSSDEDVNDYNSVRDDSESEYEQMELSDDDVVEGVELQSNKNGTEHPLRLERLRHPDDERAQRALAALERRITGKRAVVPQANPREYLQPDASLSHISSDEDDFEQDELSASSEEVSDGVLTEGEHNASHLDHPSKRIKLVRCAKCGCVSCVCTTIRMQRLLKRIQPCTIPTSSH